MIDTIVFWQGIPSIHQVGLLESLANYFDVHLVTEEEIPDQRRQMGWTHPRFRGVNVHASPSDEVRSNLELISGSRAVHIFSGVGLSSKQDQSLMRASATGARVGIYSESFQLNEWKAPARVLRAAKSAFRLRSNIDFVLATGEAAKKQQRLLHGSRARVYDFGYFLDGYPISEELSAASNDRPRLCFVGSLERRKNVHNLIHALSSLGHLEWTFDFIGSGSMSSRLRSQVHDRGISGRVSFIEPLANSEVRERLLQYDALVLPSRHDGWGAVVNEALHAGARAVVSSQAGSNVLVGSAGVHFGQVVGVDSRSIARGLEAVIEGGPVSLDERRTRSAAAEARFSAPVAAAYLGEVLSSCAGGEPESSPVPPWKRPL